MKSPPSLNQKKLLRYGLQGVALGVLATVLVIAFTAREETFEHLRQFSPFFLILLFGMVVTAWICNATRVRIMCRAAGYSLSFRQSLAVSMSTEFGIAATPAGVGGTVIRLSLLRRAGIPLTESGSLLAADAAIDLLFFTLLAPAAGYVLIKHGLLRQLTDEPTELDALFLLSALIALIVGVVILLRSDRFHRVLARLADATAFGRRHRLEIRHRHLRITVARSVRRVSSSLVFLWRERKITLLLNFAIASVQWCCRYLLLPVILYSLGVAANPLPLFLVQGVLFGLSLLVVVPGGGGSVELLSALVLPNFAPGHIVGVVVLVWRFFTYHLYLLGGGTMFFYTCHRLHRLFPATPEGETDDPAWSKFGT